MSPAKGLSMTEYSKDTCTIDANSAAALGICESLLLALIELKLITNADARGLLSDVATTHREAADTSEAPEMHRAVVAIIERILDGKNGMRWH
jgi:hypothetical protein